MERLKSLYKRLTKNQELLQKYDKISKINFTRESLRRLTRTVSKETKSTTSHSIIACIGVSTPSPSKSPPLSFSPGPPLNMQNVQSPFLGNSPLYIEGGISPSLERKGVHTLSNAGITPEKDAAKV